jgi:O-antigen ligase
LGYLVFILISMSIFATMTRSIWLSYIIMVCGYAANNRKSGLSKSKLAFAAVTLGCVLFTAKFAGLTKLTSERLHDQQNITFRINLYDAGFKMFAERPMFGWGMNSTPSHLPEYLYEYNDKVFVHNSYLEILIEQGIVGLALYIMIFFHCFKIGTPIYRFRNKSTNMLIDADFILYWRVFLVVYLVNGMFVVMNYQFINALIFTIAGIISSAEIRLNVLTKLRN